MSTWERDLDDIRDYIIDLEEQRETLADRIVELEREVENLEYELKEDR